MAEYIVDSVSSGAARGHYIGDAPHPTEEPETHYFKKPIEERLALRTGQRAAEGWRLVSTSATQRESGYTVFLFFERETRTPSRSELTHLDEQGPKAAPPQLRDGPGGGGGTEVISAPPTPPPTARPTAPTGDFIERIRRGLRGD